ncbi:MAG: hypothetical protein VB939_11155, partial [Pseudomonadales bacterium]
MTEIAMSSTSVNPPRSIVHVSVVSVAWRNLWRNKRRTSLMVSSVAFVAFLIVVMHSMQVGVFSTMIDMQ